jgi:hypothetical protein
MGDGVVRKRLASGSPIYIVRIVLWFDFAIETLISAAVVLLVSGCDL